MSWRFPLPLLLLESDLSGNFPITLYFFGHEHSYKSNEQRLLDVIARQMIEQDFFWWSPFETSKVIKRIVLFYSPFIFILWNCFNSSESPFSLLVILQPQYHRMLLLNCQAHVVYLTISSIDLKNRRTPPFVYLSRMLRVVSNHFLHLLFLLKCQRPRLSWSSSLMTNHSMKVLWRKRLVDSRAR